MSDKFDAVRQAEGLFTNFEKNSWGVYKFPWGAGVKDELTGKWHVVFLATGQEIDVSKFRIVSLTDSGVCWVI